MAKVTTTKLTRTFDRRNSVTTVQYKSGGKSVPISQGNRATFIKAGAVVGATLVPGAALPVSVAMTKGLGVKNGTLQQVMVRTNKKTGAKSVRVQTITRGRGVSMKAARRERAAMVRGVVGAGGIRKNNLGMGISRGRTRRNQARDSRGRFR